MVRRYVKPLGSRNYKNYTQDQLNEAIEKVADGELTMKAAAKRYKIPYGTINNKYHGRHGRNVGGQCIFSQQEERALLAAALKCADWGFPLNLMEIRMLAKNYLDRKGRIVQKFTNNLPGKDWALGLLARHKTDVSQRVSRNINKARASVSRLSIEEYFNNLENTLEGIPPSHIFNYDETNVGDDPGAKRLIYRRGVKYPENIVNHSKSCTTIMICGSADGTLLPPYVIYKSEHLYNTWKEGGTQGKPCCVKSCCSLGCRFNRTSHGWMDSLTFEDWFQTLFLPHARKLEGRKVLIGDNLASHFNDEVLRMCEENDISFVCLVPHSTHLLQPLDVAFFKPFKVAWRAVLSNFKLKHTSTSGIPKDQFPSLLKLALEKMDNVTAQSKNKPGDNEESGVKRNLINGFFATGIHPPNRNKVLDKLPEVQHDPTQEINDTLTNLLREKRYGQGTERVRRKKTRLNVVPGRSIATNPDSSSSEDNDNSEQEEVEDQGGDEVMEEIVEEVDYRYPERELLLPETFVLIKYVSGKRNSTIYRYVCRIREQFSEDEWTVVGLKSTDAEKTHFKLVEKDISTVPIADIIAVLPNPTQEDDRTFTFERKVDVVEL